MSSPVERSGGVTLEIMQQLRRLRVTVDPDDKVAVISHDGPSTDEPASESRRLADLLGDDGGLRGSQPDGLTDQLTDGSLAYTGIIDIVRGAGDVVANFRPIPSWTLLTKPRESPGSQVP